VPEIKVEQTRTKADPTLVETGRALGESYMPKEIDFSIPGYDVTFPSEDDKEKKTKKKKKEEKKVEKKDGKDGVVVDDGSGKKASKKKKGGKVKNIIEKIKTSIEKIKSKKKEKKKEEFISIEKKDIKKLPETDPKNQPKKVEVDEVKIRNTKLAHENPDYKENWQADKELGKKWIKYDPKNPGYSYNTDTDAKGNVTKKWTYRGREVDITEVPEDFIDQAEEWEAKQNAESVNKDNQQNNQQNNQESNQNNNQQINTDKNNENTNIDSIKEDKGFSDATIENERVDTEGVWKSEKKPHPRDFKGTFWEKQEMYKKAQKEWWKNHGHMQKFGKPHPDNK
jgi:hypothetical protein